MLSMFVRLKSSSLSRTEEWVLSKLVQNVENALANDGAANRALELIGKEHRMFIDRKERAIQGISPHFSALRRSSPRSEPRSASKPLTCSRRWSRPSRTKNRLYPRRKEIVERLQLVASAGVRLQIGRRARCCGAAIAARPMRRSNLWVRRTRQGSRTGEGR